MCNYSTDRSITSPSHVRSPHTPHTPHHHRRPFASATSGPADGDLVEALHASLSPRSQYQRYHGAMPRLSSRHRERLTATDGRDHVALVALDPAGATGRRSPATSGSTTTRAAPTSPPRCSTAASARASRPTSSAASPGAPRPRASSASPPPCSRRPASPRRCARRGWRVRSFDGPTTELEADVWALMRAIIDPAKKRGARRRCSLHENSSRRSCAAVAAPGCAARPREALATLLRGAV